MVYFRRNWHGIFNQYKSLPNTWIKKLTKSLKINIFGSQNRKWLNCHPGRETTNIDGFYTIEIIIFYYNITHKYFVFLTNLTCHIYLANNHILTLKLTIEFESNFQDDFETFVLLIVRWWDLDQLVVVSNCRPHSVYLKVLLAYMLNILYSVPKQKKENLRPVKQRK